MRSSAIFVLFATIMPHFGASLTPAPRSYSTHDYYVLEHNPSGHASPEECSGALGVELVEQVGELQNHWLVRAKSSPTDLSERSVAEDTIMERYRDIKRTSSQLSYILQPRISSDSRRIAKAMISLERQIPRQRYKKRTPIPQPAPPAVPTKSDRVAAQLGITDPLFGNQWHLINSLHASFDLNVSGLWAQGVTGKGVYSAVVDDGLDLNSDDLAANFNAEGSWDFNDHTNLPLPRLSDDQHGTRCSGEIAAVKNDVCGVGVAYESKIAGIRILSGPISDADEAASLNYGYNQTSVYSCSWGPPDDGKSMEAPGLLIKKAVLNGIQKGRDGKGSIFVFASGNGAGAGDQCNFDGYTNSIYSVTVAAVDHEGKHPYYSEACAANLIVAYSSGGGNRIYTTDIGKDKCTSGHGGTSAAAPLAAGVITLALQVRPELTWRDVQHIALRTAFHINPDDPDWETTASGRPYSYKYGYGALDAWTYVELARTWNLVKPQAWVDLPQVEIEGAEVSKTGEMTGGIFIEKGGVQSKISVSSEVLKDNNFETLEHITVRVWISHIRRGDVEVQIVSPKGVTSVLAATRQYDDRTSGYPGWQFMSVKHWGENPIGDWTLHVKDQEIEDRNGSFLGWSLTLWGESIDASKATLWTFPPGAEDEEEPEPSASASLTSTATVTNPGTKTHPKPTEHLPGDHVSATGDASKPAFNSSRPQDAVSSLPSSTSSPLSTPSITPDQGYFSHMGDLLSSQTWLFVAIGAVTLFAVLAGVFFWRRSVRRRASEYSAVSGEDHPMGSMDQSASRLLRGERDGRGRTKELYNAFGEDGEESDADEQDGLVARGPSSPAGIRYHDGFLEDDQPDSAVSPKQAYRDDPVGRSQDTIHKPNDGDGSKSPSGESGSGSWEHASEDVGR